MPSVCCMLSMFDTIAVVDSNNMDKRAYSEHCNHCLLFASKSERTMLTIRPVSIATVWLIIHVRDMAMFEPSSQPLVSVFDIEATTPTDNSTTDRLDASSMP